MGLRHDTPEMERRQHLAARFLCVLMAVLVALAAVLLYTGIGEGSLVTNGVKDSTETVKPNKPFYVLVIGSDTRKGTALYTGDPNDHAQVDQHADTLTLVRVDPKNYRLTLVTVPTNTVLKGQTTTLADTLLEDDPEQTVDAVQDLTGVKIPYYLVVKFNGFEAVIEALNNITVDVDTTVRSQDPLSAKNVVVRMGKNQELLPSGALAYARAWGEYPSRHDAHRQHNIRAIERAIIAKVLKANEGTAASLADVLSENVYTNMDASLIRSLTRKFAHRGADRVKVYSCTGPNKTISKTNERVKQNKKAWKHLMYVVNRGYNPAKVSYAELKQREAEEAAAEAQQQAEQQAAEQGQYVDPNAGYTDQQNTQYQDQTYQDQNTQQTQNQATAQQSVQAVGAGA